MYDTMSYKNYHNSAIFVMELKIHNDMSYVTGRVFLSHNETAILINQAALNDEINIYAGADIFYGNENGLFGQFKETDRIVSGIVIGF